MGKVLIEIFPPLSAKVFKNAAGRVKLEEDIDESDTIRSFLGRMIEKHDGFSFLYDSTRQTVPGYICLIINDSILNESSLPALNWMNGILNDGDRLSFIPEFVGGAK